MDRFMRSRKRPVNTVAVPVIALPQPDSRFS
jgi:hypothetical protein